MKHSAFLLSAVLGLSLAGTSQAEPKGPVNCTPLGGLDQIKCIDKGGTLECVKGTPGEMCCKKNAQGGRDCYDNPGDMPGKPSTKAPVSGGGKTVAPTSTQGTTKPPLPTKQISPTKNAPSVK